MKKENFRKESGFTLVELMIAIAILAIVTALAAPSFTSSIKRNQRTSCTNQLVGTLQLARSEAVRLSRAITVTAPTGIENGITVYRDVDGDGVASADETIQVTRRCNGTAVSVSQGNIEYTYTPAGWTSPADELVIQVCDADETGESGRNIRVLVSGVVRTGAITCS
ncbi:GspH/FimT family pseudopilin [Microbulbifer magnicolonia]|uniref:GspH/FimT family pseudopilin n=1 Tax=Microbulbifer magnicolonia TaxID=3109744 RepID=UPI002B405D99|nr:GspH/FimT family pseudopilin [Microbulbifer sp. GG15]